METIEQIMSGREPLTRNDGETDAEYAARLIDAAIELRGPDFNYEPQGAQCMYLHAGPTPGCIWGTAMVLAGIPANQIARYEGAAIAVPLGMEDGTSTSAAEDLLGIQDSKVLTAMAFSQSLQDAGNSWTLARKAFKRELAR